MSSQNEIRQEITSTLVDLLKKGVKPWRKPWSSDPGCGVPTNVVSRRPYSGINFLSLSAASMIRGFKSKFFATYRQWASLGGQVMRRPDHVKPGRWGTTVVFFQQIERKKQGDDGEERVERFPLMKTYTVFSLDQVEGHCLDHLRPGNAEAGDVHPDYEHVDRLIEATGADIRHGGDRAFYKRPVGEWPNHTGGDYIQVPTRGLFATVPDYYTTLLHELSHFSEVRTGWAGSYAAGEIRAELAACFLAGQLSIPIGEHLENSASYLQAWLKELEKDDKALFKAAAAANRAADYIMSFVKDEEHEPDHEELAQV
jgi:antirestriction protein ArdC